MEAIRSSETSVNTTSTRCHIPEDCFLHYVYCLQYRIFELRHLKNTTVSHWLLAGLDPSSIPRQSM
jgi:hypothetical protein